jgi:hypothetical protein
MSILVDLTPTEEVRLSDVAYEAGLAPEELVRKLVCDHLPISRQTEQMRRGLAGWQERNQTLTLPFLESYLNVPPRGALFQKWTTDDNLAGCDETSPGHRLSEEYEHLDKGACSIMMMAVISRGFGA